MHVEEDEYGGTIACANCGELAQILVNAETEEITQIICQECDYVEDRA